MRTAEIHALVIAIATAAIASGARAQSPDAGSPAPEEEPGTDAPDADAPEADEPPPEADEPPAPAPPPEQPAPPAEPPPAEHPTAVEREPAPQPTSPAPPPASESPPSGGPQQQPPPTMAQEPEPRPLDDRPATAPPPAPAGEGRDARRQKEKDEDGPGEPFWIEPFFGYSYVNLVQFRQDNFLPSNDKIEAHGFAGGLALGFRIWWISLGARGVAARYPDFYIGSAMFDAALRVPLGPLEPYVRAGLGYAWVGNPNFDDLGSTEIDIHGLIAEAGAGLDFWLTDVVVLGFGVDATFLNLTRQGDEGCGGGACRVNDVQLDDDGDATGFQLRAQGHIGFRF
ncbi:MAG: hypothetical protein ACODAU_11360 [Myxococcota bacterium]